MKNIHLLPTDKPSRLFLKENTLLLNNQYTLQEVFPKGKCQNIYITSDEEIKEGEYGICLNLVREGFKSHQAVFKMDAEQRQAMDELGGQKKAEVLKIILTTDPDLIKDGVQAIDDDFLEWFVKNPSCEKVGIIDDKKLSSKSIYDAVEGDLVYSHHGYGGIINSLSKDVRVGIDNYIETAITSETGWETLDINNYKIYDKCYKIIIPKEEPKQETLEEVAEVYTEFWLQNKGLLIRDAFAAGAKWQQEQDKKLYSEEEVLNFTQTILMQYKFGNTNIEQLDLLKETLEQFKKK